MRQKLTIGMEYVTSPDSKSISLKQVITANPAWWTLGEKAIVLIGIAHGIDYLHSCGIIHRDMKPSNVLLDHRRRPKICDFDISRVVCESSVEMTANIGTCSYMAPEVSSGNYNEKADLYSYGAILYEIFEGTDSFVIHVARHHPRVVFTDKTPKIVQDLIESCLVLDPDDRCCFLDEDDTSLCLFVENIARDSLNLSQEELAKVLEYLEDLQRETSELTCQEDDATSA